MNGNPLQEVLDRFVASGPHLFAYELGDRLRRAPPSRADGVLDCRIWRSSTNYEYGSVASDGPRQWRGGPAEKIDEEASEPSPLLHPLWLVWCLFGAGTVSPSDDSEEGADSTTELVVECDLELATRATGLDLDRPSEDQSMQTLHVSLAQPENELAAIEGEAYLARARIELLPGRVDPSELRWSRINALVSVSAIAEADEAKAGGGDDDTLARATHDIDEQLVAAVTSAIEEHRQDPKTEVTVLERVIRANPKLIKQLADRYKTLVPHTEEDEAAPESVLESAYLLYWLGDHAEDVPELADEESPGS
jgi:hypothetical protein